MATHYVNQVAPNYVHAGMRPSSSSSNNDDSFTFTVGKLDAGMAILIGERASLIEFPSLLLPPGVSSGSVVNIRVLRNQDEEKRQKSEFDQLQEDILSTFGTEAPKPPALRLRNVTQTSVTLEWDRLSLATASLLSLDIYRNGQRLAPIPNPLHNTSTKLSGLDLDAEYTFHLVLKTTAGTFASPVIRTRTHTIHQTSGISVCFGHVADPEVLAAAKDALGNMQARWSDRIQIDTTHFVCTDPRNPGDTNAGNGQGNGYAKAMQLSIPVVKPHWIFACHDQKKMVGIAPYYLDQDPPNATTIRDSIARLRGNQAPAAAAASAAADGQAAPVEAAAQAAVAAAKDMDTAVAPASPPRADPAPEPAADGHEVDEHDLPPIPLSMVAGSAAGAGAAATAEEGTEHGPPSPSPADGPAPDATTTNELGLQLTDGIDEPGYDGAPTAAAHRPTPPVGSPNPSIEVTGPDEESGTPIGFDDDGEEITHFPPHRPAGDGDDDGDGDEESITRRLEQQAEQDQGGDETHTQADGGQDDADDDEGEMDDVSLGGGGGRD
ncbi:uncharacterized protein PFL1_01908 [Pseudozyma flocculosa PF-1]|uniref:Related to CHS5 - chitin biosynthesis protein n=1 Tax=Pseudozyma flocculosa TaxID=84751 RepID=A0A5C3F052_9BASI|nr:uncharacterized protein PFL1_01908 [Pseudozyma flocculosa PF-1]EPQ30382.1 hypothetical protein PFL1_01908 [Pseudozyma flocculosa PF-1]SPO37455.1 related to CHS5 - chitin biosynthesis protein [Pseudozyma flocculosa]